jgi:hypothetical protein
MQEAAALRVRELITEIAGQHQLPHPDVLIGDGYEIALVPASSTRAAPVLTVGDRLAYEAPRTVLSGLLARELASASLDTPQRRRAERVRAWMSGAVKVSIAVLGIGLLASNIIWTFSGGMGLVMVIYSLWSTSAMLRENTYAADKLAASWVGLQALVDGLRWQAERAEPTVRRRSAVLTAAFAPPSVQDRLTELGARSPAQRPTTRS